MKLPMDDGYDFSSPDPRDELSDLDEYVTEYVDGTMDPAVREAFEEYLQANPHLLEYVCCLSDVRCALQDLNCSCRAPSGVQARLRRRVAGDMVADESRTGVFGSGRKVAPLAVAATALVLVSVGTIWMAGPAGRSTAGAEVGVQTAASSPAESFSGDGEEALAGSTDASSRDGAVLTGDPAPRRGQSLTRSSSVRGGVRPGSSFRADRRSGLATFTQTGRFERDRMARWTTADARQGPPVDAPSFRPPSRLPSGLDNAMVRQSEAAPNAQLLVQFE